MKQIMMLLAAMLLTCCSSDSEVNAQNNTTMTEKLYITIDGQAQAVTLVDNQATKTLVEKLQQAPVTVTLSSSGGAAGRCDSLQRLEHLYLLRHELVELHPFGQD